MDEERRRILRMLAEGSISVEECEELLKALSERRTEKVVREVEAVRGERPCVAIDSDMRRDMLGSEQCVSAFGRMFWAFLFFLDVRIGMDNVHVDILPDFIGWILIASALTSIMGLSGRVARIRTLAYWLIFLSLFDLVEIRIPLGHAGAIKTWITPTFPIGFIAAVLDIVLIWKLCGLIMGMADVAGDSVTSGKADFRRKLYLVFVVSFSAAIAICFIAPPFIPVALIVGLPVAIIVFCLMMGLMKATQNMCRNFRTSGGPCQ